MKINLKPNRIALARLTAAGLVSGAVAIWIQWLSGDPAYPKIPPGPFLFVLVAVLVAWGTRWWWTPLLGALLSLLVTVGWFVRLPAETLRLSHPAAVGTFAAGIFLGTLLQIIALLVTDVAGIAATVQNYRQMSHGTQGLARAACKLLGLFFVLMGLLVIVRGWPVDRYHNLLHLVWGALALGVGFAGSTAAASSFCAGSGLFYFALGVLGMLMGDPAMNRAWQVGPIHLSASDHGFHLVLGTSLLAAGLITGRRRLYPGAVAGGG
jgi:hypothetical protein